MHLSATNIIAVEYKKEGENMAKRIKQKQTHKIQSINCTEPYWWAQVFDKAKHN